MFDEAVGNVGGWCICMVGGSVGVFVGFATPVRGRGEEVVLESWEESCEEGEEDGAEEEEGDKSDEVLDGLSEESVPDRSIAWRSNKSAHSRQ